MDKKIINATVRVGHVQCSRGPDHVVIAIEDRTSGIPFLELKLNFEQFGRMLAGNIMVDAEGEGFGFEYVGKKRVTELRSITCPDLGYKRSLYEDWLKENAQEDGWLLNTYLGSQRSISYKDGFATLNYSVTKYVEVEDEVSR